MPGDDIRRHCSRSVLPASAAATIASNVGVVPPELLLQPLLHLLVRPVMRASSAGSEGMPGCGGSCERSMSTLVFAATHPVASRNLLVCTGILLHSLMLLLPLSLRKYKRWAVPPCRGRLHVDSVLREPQWRAYSQQKGQQVRRREPSTINHRFECIVASK